MHTPAQNEDWEKYRSFLSEYESMLAYARQMSTQLVGITPEHKYLQYAEQILVKALAHCVTFRELVIHLDKNNVLWDLSSLSAIARSIIETHDALAYIALENVTTEERNFRIILWEYHDTSRRLKMLTAIGSQDPQFFEMKANSAAQKQKVISDPHFANLNGNVQRKINEDDPPPYHLSQRERCSVNRINFDFYNFATMQLSQHVHTLPYCIHQFFHFRAGSKEALHLMAMPIQFTLPFLARTIEGILLLFPGKCESPSKDVQNSIELWSHILESGLKTTSSSNSVTP